MPDIGTIPFAGYRLGLLADPDEKLGSRIVRSFGNLKIGNVLRSLQTFLINMFPLFSVLIFIALFYLPKYYYHFPVPPLHSILLLISLLVATLITCKLSIYNLLVPYLIVLDSDVKSWGSGKVRSTSKKMMDSHVNEMNILYFRLFLIGIPSTFLIIPLIWFIPYAYATLTNYALSILEEGGYVSYAEDEEETVNELDSLLQ